MGKLCHLQNFILLLSYNDTFIDSYCLLQCDYTYFHLNLLWVDSVVYIKCECKWSVGHLTFHNIHMDMDMALCLHIITVTYFRYQNRGIQNKYHNIYHNLRILNLKSLNFEI